MKQQLSNSKLNITCEQAPKWSIKLIPLAMLLLAPSAFALNTGTDLNLSMKPIAGGMAGAAYTKPQEISAALFGNPATLTQFKGFNIGFGAGILEPVIDNYQYRNGFENHSHNLATNYIVPDLALGGEVLPGLVLGAGLGFDSGLATDFRTHPINAGAGLGLGGQGAGGAATLPLLTEVLSLSANVGGAYQLTPKLSLGAALTVAFGFAQLGTSGNTTGLSSLTGDFGGTTSSVHNISARGSFGVTYQLMPNLMLSAGMKTPLKYDFHDVLSTTVGGSQRYQSVKIEQPLEVNWGLAVDVTPKLLVEVDAVWKNWSNAEAYKDVFQDQFLGLLGSQFTEGNWKFRAGYQYASAVHLDNPNGTIGNFTGIGTLPFNTAVPGVMNNNDLIKLVQTTLVPVATQHNLSAGIGYAFSPKFRIDAFGSYNFQGTVTRNTLAFGQYTTHMGEWALGAGANFKF